MALLFLFAFELIDALLQFGEAIQGGGYFEP
jgi:hypothetical protein